MCDTFLIKIAPPFDTGSIHGLHSDLYTCVFGTSWNCQVKRWNQHKCRTLGLLARPKETHELNSSTVTLKIWSFCTPKAIVQVRERPVSSWFASMSSSRVVGGNWFFSGIAGSWVFFEIESMIVIWPIHKYCRQFLSTTGLSLWK